MAESPRFDPDAMAYYEKSGWEAYYARKWPRAFWLLLRMNRDCFGMSWRAALLAALDTVRASIAFAPVANDVPRAREHLRAFYERARRAGAVSGEPEALASLEMDYWLVHRELANRRKQNSQDQDIEPMIDSLARLHAALFASTFEAMRPSAEQRALAAKTVDLITSGQSTDIARDWQQVEQYLRNAYHAVGAAS